MKKVLGVKLSEETISTIKADADKRNITVSDWLKLAIAREMKRIKE